MKVYDFGYTGSGQPQILDPGEYLLECWGASGGGSEFLLKSIYLDLGNAGRGGYSKGILKLFEKTQLYIYVGGVGKTPTTYDDQYMHGGFNGGGSSWHNGYHDPGASGGGATDIRIVSDTVHDRIIVAGGGGGGGDDSYNSGGYGGGLSGYSFETTASPGNQIGTYQYGTGGRFGFGAHTDCIGGGAGGGWYGASAANGKTEPEPSSIKHNIIDSGAGGSGYVYTTSTESYYPSPKPHVNYMLTNAETIEGNKQFKDPQGNDIVGNLGNGFARITQIEAYNYFEENGIIYNTYESGSVISYSISTCGQVLYIKNEINRTSINSISEKAFMNNQCLRKIFIPSSIKFIYANAFSGCTNLETVMLAKYSELGYIDNKAFYNTKIANFSIPLFVGYIGALAFANSANLESVSCCSITYIQQADVFNSCPKLKNVLVSQHYIYSTFGGKDVLRTYTKCVYGGFRESCHVRNNPPNSYALMFNLVV